MSDVFEKKEIVSLIEKDIEDNNTLFQNYVEQIKNWNTKDYITFQNSRTSEKTRLKILKKGLKIIENFRTFLTDSSIEYIFIPKNFDLESIKIKSEEEFYKKFLSKKVSTKSGKGIDIVSGKDRIMTQKELEENEEKRRNFIYQLIIRDRINYVEKVWNDSSKERFFITYYAENLDAAKNLQKKYINNPARVYLSNKERYNQWMSSQSGIQKKTKKISKDSEVRYITDLEKDSPNYRLYAYSENFKKIYLIGASQGKRFEALLHAASSIITPKDEFNRYNEQKNLQDLQNVKPYDYNGIRMFYTIDDAFIASINHVPFYKKGDVEFEMFNEKGEKILLSLQAKILDSADIKRNTIINAMIKLYEMFSEKGRKELKESLKNFFIEEEEEVINTKTKEWDEEIKAQIESKVEEYLKISSTQ